MSDKDIAKQLRRLADAVERLSPPSPDGGDLSGADAFVWQASSGALEPVARINRHPLSLLKGIDRARDILLNNTRRFAAGLPANNALLWGARGMGKSSLVKAVHGEVSADKGKVPLKLVEIHREDLASLPKLLRLLRAHPARAILFCDDLSFDALDASYKSLKALLEGGVEGRPENVLFYATSNRRHLMPREMIENEQTTAIHAGDTVDEKISLSDRFGLWIGFHNCDKETYLAIIEGYCDAFGLKIARKTLHAEANEWSVTRGARSGRVAWQFIQDLAGRLGQRLDAPGD